MTAVAAANPQAWFPVARGVDEIIGPTADNRMVGYPYSKLMTAIMDVDMAAAVLVASDATRRLARGAGTTGGSTCGAGATPRTRRPWPGASDLWRSGAMEAARRAALLGAGAGVDDVAHLDLYSCFASSIAFALDALGIDPAAARSRGPGRRPNARSR